MQMQIKRQREFWHLLKIACVSDATFLTQTHLSYAEPGVTDDQQQHPSVSLSPPPGSKLLEELDGSESRVVHHAAGVSVVPVGPACQLPTPPHLPARAKRQVREPVQTPLFTFHGHRDSRMGRGGGGNIKKKRLGVGKCND